MMRGITKALIGTIGLAFAVTVTLVGCGGGAAADDAARAAEGAARELRPGTGRQVTSTEVEGNRAIVTVEYADERKDEFEAVKKAGEEGGKWVLENCNQLNSERPCLPEVQDPIPGPNVSAGYEYIDCITDVKSVRLWILCDPLVNASDSTGKRATYRLCRLVGTSALRCALRLGAE